MLHSMLCLESKMPPSICTFVERNNIQPNLLPASSLNPKKPDLFRVALSCFQFTQICQSEPVITFYREYSSFQLQLVRFQAQPPVQYLGGGSNRVKGLHTNASCPDWWNTCGLELTAKARPNDHPPLGIWSHLQQPQNWYNLSEKAASENHS